MTVIYECVATYGMLGEDHSPNRPFQIDDMIFDVPPNTSAMQGNSANVSVTFGGGVKISRGDYHNQQLRLSWPTVPYGTLSFTYLSTIFRESVRDVNLNESLWSSWLDEKHTMVLNGRTLSGYIIKPTFVRSSGTPLVMTKASAELTWVLDDKMQ